MASHDDPRDLSNETRMTLPRQWSLSDDFMSSSAMFLSGLIMVTKNRYLAWFNLLYGLSAYINRHPMRSKEATGVSSIMMAVMALGIAYVPVFTLPPSVKPPPPA